MASELEHEPAQCSGVPPRERRWRDRLTGRGWLWLLFLLSIPLVTPRIRGADEIQYFSLLRSLAFDHDLDFENEYRHFYERDPGRLAGFKATFLDRREPITGRSINFGYIGAGLLWAPAYGLAHLGVWLARVFGLSVDADGFSPPYEAAVCLSSALLGFLGLLLIHDMLRRYGSFSETLSTWSVVTIWLGTPTVYYLTIAPGFAHAPALFAVSLACWLWLRLRVRQNQPWTAWALVGLAGGLAGLVRPHGLLFLVAPAADLVWRSWREARLVRGAVRLIAMSSAAAMVISPQSIVNLIISGSIGGSPLVARKMSYSSPHFLEVLFSPAHGLYFWTPILLLATIGLPLLWRARRQAVFAWLGLAFLSQVWVNGAVESWTQAGAFGSRRFVETTVVFAFGLTFVLSRLKTRYGCRAVAAIALLSVWWNLSLMVQFGLRLMDRQRLTWPRVAINQITAVPPAAARSAWLFLSDRERLVRESAPSRNREDNGTDASSNR